MKLGLDAKTCNPHAAEVETGRSNRANTRLYLTNVRVFIANTKIKPIEEKLVHSISSRFIFAVKSLKDSSTL